MAFVSIDPTTGSRIARHAADSAATRDRVLDAARSCFDAWRREHIEDRCTVIRRIAEWLRQDRDRHADTITAEMGKPLHEARAEIDKCAWLCETVAGQAPTALASEDVPTEAQVSYVGYAPLGPVLAIMPWNFPFWQVLRCAIGAIAAGNVVVLKHAPNVQGCAATIVDLLRDAGAPAGVLQNLRVDTDAVGALIHDHRIAAVALTGSTRAGAAVAAEAGAALKPCVLELGGSDPYLIFEDADLPAAVDACVAARFANSGQSCIAGKRIIAVDAIYQEVRALLHERIRALPWGDPRAADTAVGPLARGDLRDTLNAQIATSVDQGATLLCGGTTPDGPGFGYPPTLLAEVGPGMPAFYEETFGPLAVLCHAEDEEQALALGNRTRFGLGAAVFTARLALAESLCFYDLEAGSTFVNARVRSDPRLPFGGCKQSGWGRELAVAGIRQFCNVKTVYIA